MSNAKHSVHASAPPATPEPDLLPKLQTLCAGLLFPSESDRPVDPFVWARADLAAGGDVTNENNKPAPVTALTLLAAGKVPESANVKEQDADAFLRPVLDTQDWWEQTEKNRAAKFIALRDALAAHTAGLIAFRVGETELDVYLLGRTANGDVAGFHTQLVET